MNDMKSIFQSKTFWTCIIGAAAEALTLSGVKVLDDPTLQATIVGWLTAAAALVFRHTATSKTTIPSVLAAAAIGLSLSACQPQATAVVTTSLNEAKVAYTAADNAALIYLRLPVCVVGSPVRVCADPGVKAKIKELDNKAYNAIKAAETNAALISVALEAVGALQAATPKTN